MNYHMHTSEFANIMYLLRQFYLLFKSFTQMQYVGLRILKIPLEEDCSFLPLTIDMKLMLM